MKIVSFNVNGIRARPHQLAAIVTQLNPDIIGLQETKVRDEDFPLDMVQSLGYHVEYFGQKAHYGVALLSKQPPLELSKGFSTDSPDTQKRIITGTYVSEQGNQVTLINGYFPQGENRTHSVKFPAKERFYKDLLQHLELYVDRKYLGVMGDMNVAPTDLDIGIGEDNTKRWLRTGKCSFLPEERVWMQGLLSWGLTDSFRSRFPQTSDHFSWFDYRSRGFEREPRRGLRIDLILASPALNERLLDAGISYEIRTMKKPSDHCPVWADFDC